MTMKTPEQIAAGVQKIKGVAGLTVRDQVRFREALAFAVRCGREQSNAALDALHTWAVNVSYSMGTDKSNDWSEEIDALVEIEQMYDLVDKDGERK